MEIEIKLAADESVFEGILALDALGPYRLDAAAEAEHQRNIYFDTPDGRLRAQRIGLRVREAGGRRVATLKTAGSSAGGLHERGEWEAEIGEDDRPESWPEGELRDRALAATGGEALLPVVEVQTVRRHVYAWLDDRRAAELSLDEGVIRAGGQELPFREVEIELLPGGERAEVEDLGALVRERFGLAPEERSKLARGLALLEDAPPATSPDAPSLPRDDWSLVDPAMALFAGASEAHRLSRGARRALLLAAACYDMARRAGAESPERAARDAALAAPVDELSSAEQAVAAGALALLRGRSRRQRDAALLRLRGEDLTHSVRLGALLRVATAVGAAGGRLRAGVAGGETRIEVAGADAARVVRAVEEQADLWRREIGPVSVRPADGELVPREEDYQGVPAVPRVPEGMRGDEPAGEAARRVLRRFFERMLAREEDVLRAEDPEDVHQMRVATRRLRASLQVAEPVYDAELVRRYRRGLRKVARALGEVRDRDVFLSSLRAHRDALPPHERETMAPLIAAVEAARARARARLEEDLAEERYARFKRAFATFLTTPLAGIAALPETGAPPRVRDLAGSGVWRRYEELRAFEAVIGDGQEERLHMARIAGKRLRYTLEFFHDALGPRADEALGPLAELQETLGALQDAVVARQHVRDLGMEGDAGARGYLEALDAAHAAVMAEVPRVWGEVVGERYRRLLLELIVEL